MASITKQITYGRDGISAQIGVARTLSDESAFIDDSVQISEADELEINTGGVVGPCILAIQNTDPDNFLQFGTVTETYTDIIPAGDVLIRQFPQGVNTFFAIADTAAVVAKIVAVQLPVPE